MTRKMNSLLNKIVGFSLLGVAILGSGLAFGISRIEYAVYENQYNEELIELQKQNPTLPEDVFINNQFVTYDENKETILYHESNYHNIYTIRSSQATFSSNHNNGNDAKYEVFDETSTYGQSLGGFDTAGGGTVVFNINVVNYCDADIDIVLASANWSSEISGNTSTINLSQYINITFDDLFVDASHIDLPCSNKDNWFEFNHIILSNCHLRPGNNSIVLSSRSDAPKIVMPNINLVHVFTDGEFEKQLSVKGDTMMLIRQNNKRYMIFTGTCFGYKAEQLSIDLCFDSQTVNQIPEGALEVYVRDGCFIMKVDLSSLPNGRLYSHFYLNGELYNSGREEGDIMTVSFAEDGSYNSWDNPKLIQTLGEYKILCQSRIMVIEINHENN